MWCVCVRAGGGKFLLQTEYTSPLGSQIASVSVNLTFFLEGHASRLHQTTLYTALPLSPNSKS